METQTIEILIALWPVAINLIVFIAIPICFGIANLLCSWADRGEKTFNYPNVVSVWPYKAIAGEVKEGNRFVRTTYGEGNDDFSDVIIKIMAGYGICVSLFMFILCMLDYEYLPYLVESSLILSVVLVVVRKVMDLGKTINKHIKDKGAHSHGDSSEKSS